MKRVLNAIILICSASTLQMMLFKFYLISLGLIPRNTTSIFFATDLQIKKIF